MRRHQSGLTGFHASRPFGPALTRALFLAVAMSCSAFAAETLPRLQAILLDPTQVTDQRLDAILTQGYSTVVLGLHDGQAAATKASAARVQERGLELHYWIEIARNPALAEAHPEWMASIQTHPEWRRFFPDLPPLKSGEVVKTWPWVPVLYEETFPVHLDRVRQLLKNLPPARAIYLNDLQSGPSACGCGHPLCRWTTDYGPIRTATRLPDNAAARFVASVQSLSPNSRIVPVWATECEEADKEGLCGGVGCFKGTCWKALQAQLEPVAAASKQLALLLPYRELQRDLPRYGPKAGWIAHAVRSMELMPRAHQGTPLAPARLIAVLQGWDTSPEDIQAQINQAKQSGAAGFVVAEMKIDQSWQPRIYRPPSKGTEKAAP